LFDLFPMDAGNGRFSVVSGLRCLITNNVFPVRFGDYLLLERISTGGMAEVCLAKSFGVEGFQKTVAIKTILPHISEDENFVTMFIDEAKIAARLQHANICQVFDFGKISDDFGEHLYQVMEYIPGFSLKHLAKTFWDKKKQVPAGAALHIIARVCEGLDYAHALPDRDGRPLGIVHRDVTPANILVSIEGAVKLIDFGIAKAAQRETKTQAGIVKGKFGYMTPEQLQGKMLDGRSDIFSLGVGLWELLAGRILFSEPNELDNLRKIMNGDYPDIREIRDDLPEEICDVVMKALAHDRENRYQTAEEFAQDINQAAFKTRNFWNTTSLEKFLRENFPEEAEAEQEKRSKYADIKKEDFLKYPSVTDLGKKRLEEAEELDAGDLVMEDIEEIEEIDDEDDEESQQDRTVVSRVPLKKSSVSRGASSGGSVKTPQVQHKEIAAPGFSGSLDLDAPRREANRQSVEYPTFTQENQYPYEEQPAAGAFNPRATGAPSNSGYAGSEQPFNPRATGAPSNSGYAGSEQPFNPRATGAPSNNGYAGSEQPFDPRATGMPSGGYASVEQPEYPSYVSPYGELSAQNNSFIQEPSIPPEESFVDETAAYRPGSTPSQQVQGYYGEDGQWYPYPQQQQAQGYYGEDGQWYPYAQQQQPQGYYGEDGQWYPYAQQQQAQGYYGEDGQWYPYTQQQQAQGYYGEDGRWYPYAQQQQAQGYYGEDGQWYPYDQQQQQPQGYYGDDGQWHSYPNPYYQSTNSYPDYSYPDHSRPDLPIVDPGIPPKKR